MTGPYDVVIREKESAPPPSEEVVHSWAPKKPSPAKEEKTTTEMLRELIKGLASWVIVVALAIDGLALFLEPFELLRHGAPVSAAIASTLASFGLASVFSIAAAVPIGAAYSSVRLIGRLRRPWSFAWPAPLIVTGWLIVTNLAPHPVATVMSKAAAQWLLFCLLGGLLILATLVARIERTFRRILAGVALIGFMVALEAALPPSIHGEPRDVVWFCLVMCAVALLYPMRRTMRAATYPYVLRRLGALVVTSLLISTLAPVVSPSWRVYARDYGAFADRIGRFWREIADLDGDGYAAVFGGLDCDDLDAMRNPGMLELVKGVDRNCNGVLRTEHPSPAQLGLAAEVGDPDAAEGEIDRVVVVTFDCFRNDAFTPAVTPNLVQLAAKGVTLAKLYAGGSRTALSFPLMWRGAYDRRPVAELLHAAGVTSSAIFAYDHGTLEGNVLDGFEVLQRPPNRDKRFRASEVTDWALADLRDPAHASKHLLWAHYFDAHGPRAEKFLPPEVKGHAPIPGEGSASAIYLDELAYDDRELGVSSRASSKRAVWPGRSSWSARTTARASGRTTCSSTGSRPSKRSSTCRGSSLRRAFRPAATTMSCPIATSWRRSSAPSAW